MNNDLKLDRDEMQELNQQKKALVDLITDDGVYLLDVTYGEDHTCHDEKTITIKLIKFDSITEELNWQY